MVVFCPQRKEREALSPTCPWLMRSTGGTAVLFAWDAPGAACAWRFARRRCPNGVVEVPTCRRRWVSTSFHSNHVQARPPPCRRSLGCLLLFEYLSTSFEAVGKFARYTQTRESASWPGPQAQNSSPLPCSESEDNAPGITTSAHGLASRIRPRPGARPTAAAAATSAAAWPSASPRTLPPSRIPTEPPRTDFGMLPA